jgi:3',5'-cyclic AMP phosphodiesterase CpdA
MTTLVQISDLHFNRVTPTVVEALARAIEESSPNLLVVSGDLTQRGFRKQFRAARTFLDRFSCDKLQIAGNHDVPIHRPLLRLVSPYAAFRKHACDQLQPWWDDGTVCVVGINTARRFSPRPRGFWKDGTVRAADIKNAVRVFSKSLAPYRIVVTHHPLMVADPHHAPDLAVNSKQTLSTLADFGVEAFLYGHLHRAHILPTTLRSGDGPAHNVVGVMAGTACSTRLRDNRPNSFNRLRFDETGFTIESLDLVGDRFEVVKSHRMESQRKRVSPVRR